MLGSRNFIISIFFIFLDLIIGINLIYAFNLQGILPTVYAGSLPSDLTGKYFGVSSLIDGFIGYFQYNPFLTEIKTSMTTWAQIGESISLTKLFTMTIPQEELQYWDTLIAVLNIVNLIFNVVYQFGAIIYGLLLLVYAISIVIHLLLFMLNMASGQYALDLPNTYGTIYTLITI